MIASVIELSEMRSVTQTPPTMNGTTFVRKAASSLIVDQDERDQPGEDHEPHREKLDAPP